LRLWLVNQVRGLGWKEASHFLRNVGHRDLAILDRHILRNLIRTGVLRRLPKTLTAKRYAAIEAKFRDFAGQVGIPMDELDLLFWSMETGTVLK
jgi:N-glycosylase/DNA lyase